MVKLDEVDRKKLVEMYATAQRTPVITLGYGMTDFATQAWNEVRAFMQELGKKYGFDPGYIKGIDANTGEIK